MNMSSMVSSLDPSPSMPVSTVLKPAVRGVTAENRLASTLVPTLMPRMVSVRSMTRKRIVGTTTQAAVEISTILVCR